MGTFFLFPEVKVLPLQELRMDDSDDEEKSTLRRTLLHFSLSSPARLTGFSYDHACVDKRSFAEISDASLATIDHEGKVRLRCALVEVQRAQGYTDAPRLPRNREPVPGLSGALADGPAAEEDGGLAVPLHASSTVWIRDQRLRGELSTLLLWRASSQHAQGGA